MAKQGRFINFMLYVFFGVSNLGLDIFMYSGFLAYLSKKSRSTWKKLAYDENKFFEFLHLSNEVSRNAHNGISSEDLLITRLIGEAPKKAKDQLATELVEWLLHEDGFKQSRRAKGSSDQGNQSTSSAVHYRPSDHTFLANISDQHPLLMTTTLEPQRLIDSTVAKFASGELPARRIFVWKITSGLKEVSIQDGKFVQEPWASVDHELAEAEWNISYFSKLADDPDELREKLSESDFDEFDIDGDGPICPMFFRIGRINKSGAPSAELSDNVLEQILGAP